ncbi:CinA family protein [Parapedobacter lycopersici]|uniref:CinA family protein n=1 Tax=Parapedobacter lycopersici TaxID=1864939 RepID=UPI003340171E
MLNIHQNDPVPLPAVARCARLLTDKELTVAFAESATGGRLCAEFTLAPNAGAFLKGSIVCYDACIKHTLLGVPMAVIERHTAESSEVTRLLALGLRNWIDADIYIAVTGLTHPGGSESAAKPVGTMFIHLLDSRGEVSLRKTFEGSPETIVLQTVSEIANYLIRHF